MKIRYSCSSLPPLRNVDPSETSLRSHDYGQGCQAQLVTSRAACGPETAADLTVSSFAALCGVLQQGLIRSNLATMDQSLLS